MTLADLIPSLRSSLPRRLEPGLWPASAHHLPGGGVSLGGVSLRGVATAYATPTVVLDSSGFRGRCQTLRQSFRDMEVTFTGRSLLAEATASAVDVDGGMTDNPRPALYGSRYTARMFGRNSPAPSEHVTVAGRHCEAGDILIDDVLLPADIRTGDLLAVPATGAYHHAMASNYNLTPRPPLVGVEAGRSRPLVRGETMADLMSRDMG